MKIQKIIHEYFGFAQHKFLRISTNLFVTQINAD